MTIDAEAFERARRNAAEHLLSQRTAGGHWVGHLASSALSTATAVAALALIDRARDRAEHRTLIEGGARWLIAHQNEDGGWGDTVRSFSNISTTMLGWAALGLDEAAGVEGAEAAARNAEGWLNDHAGSLAVPWLVKAVMRRYGKDRTFSVPILTMCTLCGRLGDPEDRRTWRWVTQLPFELAAFPHEWFRFLRLPVVSYALPALIAIGRVRHARRPTRNPLTRLLREATKRRTVRVLDRIQPSNGGFLEATPLTSFVTMSLAGCGLSDHAVARRGVGFIVNSVRADGSWPIDTNLATWVTTLSVNALAAGGRLDEYLDEPEQNRLRDWLLDQQYREVHPYTNAPPGGWAWTPLPGGVPDADDTSGALIALSHLNREAAETTDEPSETGQERVRQAADAGLHWLRGLQNSDNGIPTFCRGWGKLPFDRSSADLTAHFVRAADAWLILTESEPAGALSEASAGLWARDAIEYLRKTQREGGNWLPLWFGNQYLEAEENPTYGTSRVLIALRGRLAEEELALHGNDAVEAGVRWLIEHQNADGGWGAGDNSPSSIEETALAVEALAAVAISSAPAQPTDPAALNGPIERGLGWLIEQTDEGTTFEPNPIGFYFAKLWYFERLYPVVWTVAALERVGAWRAARAEAAAESVEGAKEAGSSE